MGHKKHHHRRDDLQHDDVDASGLKRDVGDLEQGMDHDLERRLLPVPLVSLARLPRHWPFTNACFLLPALVGPG